MLFLLVMGVIDFGMILNNQSSLRQVTRTVARDVTIDSVDHDGICQNYVDGADSYNVQSKAVICEVKEQLGGEPDTNRVKVVFPEVEGQTRRDKVIVCAQQPMRSLSGMFSSMVDDKVISASVVMRIEIEPDDDKADDVQETPLTGTDWTWCS